MSLSENHDSRIERSPDASERIFSGLKIGKHQSKFPIIQGGMGIGISLGRLSGEVSYRGGIGTLSSAGLCKLPKYKHMLNQGRSYQEVNAECIKLEIAEAKKIAQGKSIFMNVMSALNGFPPQILASCEGGADGIVCGAGLPLALPAITKDFPDVALIPIVSTEKALDLIIRKRVAYNRVPDAVIVEDPITAGGHLGVGSIEELEGLDPNNLPDFALEKSIPAIKKYLESKGLGYIPVIAAGGMIHKKDIDRVMGFGADGVQLGTRFLASEESSANAEFKQAVVDSTDDDIIVYMSSARLPARALKQSNFATLEDTRTCIANCLRFCAYRDRKPGYAEMCILKELTKSMEGHPGGGLMFVGTCAARIHDILPVKEIMRILTEAA